jgi:hypothetical protein
MPSGGLRVISAIAQEISTMKTSSESVAAAQAVEQENGKSTHQSAGV